MEYMEVPQHPNADARCSDDLCPCGTPGAIIPRGEGYIYISKDVVDFRKDCLSLKDAEQKIRTMQASLGATILAGEGVFAPLLMCEQGARRRGIDLNLAAADARHWWKTGLVPLRPTPKEQQSDEPKDRRRNASWSGNSSDQY